jgi:predicted O-methyltransferase YrrM
MLLERAVARDDIQTVLEFGSGFSTLILAKACERYGKTLISLEESPEWAAVTQGLLDRCGVDFQVTVTGSSPPKITKRKSSFFVGLTDGEILELKGSPDLIFYDCDGDTRSTVIKKAKLLFKGAKMVICDDMEHPDYYIPVMEGLFSADKKNCCFYNPVGRQDRVVCISHADASEELNNWVWDWRPDKVFW